MQTSSEKTYTIRQLSQKYQLPASTLRYYEEIGLLINVLHTDKGARVYNEEHIARLDGIFCFKRTGLSIAKIQEFYRFEADIANHTDDIISMMTEQEAAILKQMAELSSGLAHIREKVQYYTEVKKALENGEPQPLWEDVIPTSPRLPQPPLEFPSAM